MASVARSACLKATEKIVTAYKPFLRARVIGDLHRKSKNGIVKPCVLDIKDRHDVDVNIIVGDLGNTHRADSMTYIRDLIDRDGKPVIFVPGNHDYYSSTFSKQDIDDLYIEQEYGSNGLFHYLNRHYVDLYGYRFIGATGWSCKPSETNVNWDCRKTMVDKKSNVYRDYTTYRKDTAKRGLRDTDIRMYNSMDFEFFEKAIQHRKPRNVMITHYPPSVDDKRDSPYSCGFDILMRRHSSAIPIWMAGHSHRFSDKLVNNVRTVNPGGGSYVVVF